ncbi:hypothetical protein D9M71_660780 [compost metagenome]
MQGPPPHSQLKTAALIERIVGAASQVDLQGLICSGTARLLEQALEHFVALACDVLFQHGAVHVDLHEVARCSFLAGCQGLAGWRRVEERAQVRLVLCAKVQFPAQPGERLRHDGQGIAVGRLGLLGDHHIGVRQRIDCRPGEIL